MRNILMVFLTLNAMTVYSQQQELEKYLRALKLPVSVGAKKIMNEQCFDTAEVIYNRRKIISFRDITGAKFETDIPGVKGYKASFTCYTDREGDTVERKSSAVLFYDKISKKWRVFSARELLDPCAEFMAYKDWIDGKKYKDKKHHLYSALAYWGCMCGKIRAAKKALLQAARYAKEAGDPVTTKPMARIIARIQ